MTRRTLLGAAMRRHLSRAAVVGLTLSLAACADRPEVTAPGSVAPAGEVMLSAGTSSGGYTAIDLGTLGCGFWSTAIDINNAGNVVGFSCDEEGRHRPFIWMDGVMIDVGSLGGGWNEAYTINEANQVVGISQTAEGPVRAFYWENGVMTDLGHLGSGWSGVHDLDNQTLNETGQVIVNSGNVEGQPRSFLWQSGVMTDLGTLGGSWTRAKAINNAGQVVGASQNAEGRERAFLWENGVMIDLGTLGGETSSGARINDAGQVVGWSSNAEGHRRAFLWENGVMTDLGTLGGDRSVANLINSAGQVVGGADGAEGHGRAFFWENGVMTEIGPEYYGPWDINDSGQVVGQIFTGGTYRPFLWENGVTTVLGTLGGANGWAMRINDAGLIIGTSQNAEGVERATLWVRLSSVELIERIADDVWSLASADVLNTGQAQALTNRLNVAVMMLNDGKVTPAVRQLESFINQVEAFVEGGVLSEQDGKALITAAQSVIDQIGS